MLSPVKSIINSYVFGFGDIQIPCSLVRLYAHISGTLHVILPAQRINSRTNFTDIASHHCNVCNECYGLGTLPVLRYTESMKLHCTRCSAIFYCSSSLQLPVNATFPFKLIYIQRKKMTPEFIPSLRPLSDKVFICKTFTEKIESKHIQYSYICSRIDLQ